MRQNRRKSFLERDDRHFFKKLMLFDLIRNDLITCAIIVKILSGPLKIVPWRLFGSITREKKAKVFFHCKNSLFLRKLMFSTSSWVLYKWSYYFHNTCQNTSWSLANCSLRFVILHNTRKKRPNIYVTVKVAFFDRFVSNVFLCSVELNIYLAHKLSSYLRAIRDCFLRSVNLCGRKK